MLDEFCSCHSVVAACGSLLLVLSLRRKAIMLGRAAFVPIALASLAVSALSACGLLSGGGQNAPSDDAGGADGALVKDARNLDVGVRETASESDHGPACPAAIPTSGAACTRGDPPPASTDSSSEVVSWVCEYGDDPHCDTYAECISSRSFAWLVSLPDPSCAGNPPACPAVFGADAGAGGACPIQGSCTYPEGRCSCTPCSELDAGEGTVWACAVWETPKGCPEPRPLLGSACASEGLECDYGGSCCAIVDVGPDMLCTGGYWALVAENTCQCPGHFCFE